MKPMLQRNTVNYSLMVGLLEVSYFIFLFFGQQILPECNEKIRFLIIMYLVLRTLSYLFGGLVSYFETNKICERAKNMNTRQLNEDFRNTAYFRDIFHVFVILDCRKHLQVLSQTLDRLKLHQGTKANYLVFLPTRISEHKQEEELLKLIQNYSSQFFVLDIIQLQNQISEQVGKQVDPFWFVECLEQKFSNSYNISADKVLITVLNVDSWVPEVYVRSVQDHFAESLHIAKQYIYQPTQIYTRNHLQIPFTTRICNQLDACLQANDCLSRYRPVLPHYNYSIHYCLAKKISCAANQGNHSLGYELDDSQLKLKTIYAPFNRLNKAVQGGYLSNTKTMFDDIVSNAEKELSLLYNIFKCFGISSRWRDLVSIFYVVVHITDKFLVVLVLQTIHSQTFTLLLSKAFAPLNIENVSLLLCITLMILTSVHFLCQEFAKRKASLILYSLTNKSISDIFQFNLLVGYIIVLFVVPAYVVTTFKLFMRREGESYSSSPRSQNSKMDKPQ